MKEIWRMLDCPWKVPKWPSGSGETMTDLVALWRTGKQLLWDDSLLLRKCLKPSPQLRGSVIQGASNERATMVLCAGHTLHMLLTLTRTVHLKLPRSCTCDEGIDTYLEILCLHSIGPSFSLGNIIKNEGMVLCNYRWSAKHFLFFSFLTGRAQEWWCGQAPLIL